MNSDHSDVGEPDYRPVAYVLILLSVIFAIMPVRHVLIEVDEFGLRPLVHTLALVGLPALGALVGAFLRFRGPGGRLFGVMLGIFVSTILLMALLAYWVYDFLTNL
ncbi:hypothetical protein [Streptosporangium carneum]|uniref:Uncharacterized protein n=1 Tax=Streptosporangium carneum TaxID=47481 RepID=A0A9W6I2N4_9ACTN|nr:hypothetical protein [Streptosporangium carneum]GLK10578.1 hypothetical protein GCM10017600_39840 [Streptosporangium carneum]